MATFARHVEVDWQGSVMEGKGTAKAGSGAFSLPVTFPARIGEHGGKTSPEELSQDAFAALRRPGMLLREQTEQLDRAKNECEAAEKELEHLSAKFLAAARGRRAEDLQESLAAAGQKVALLRRRLQIEERLDELARRREELDFTGDEMQQFDGLPVRYTVAFGMFFSFGIMLLLVVIARPEGVWPWIATRLGLAGAQK